MRICEWAFSSTLHSGSWSPSFCNNVSIESTRELEWPSIICDLYNILGSYCIVCCTTPRINISLAGISFAVFLFVLIWGFHTKHQKEAVQVRRLLAGQTVFVFTPNWKQLLLGTSLILWIVTLVCLRDHFWKNKLIDLYIHEHIYYG